MYPGFYASYCSFEFLHFPFDTQHCAMVFSIWFDVKQVDLTFATLFEDTNFQKLGKFMGDMTNVGWDFKVLQTTTNTVQLPSPTNFTCYSVAFQFEIARRPNYFYIFIIIPIFILTTVQFAGFFLPPEESDRSSYSVTVLLSFTVIQAACMANIPKTPARIYLSELVLAQMVTSMVITIYTALITTFCTCSKYGNKTIKTRYLGKVRMVRIIDVFMFFIIGISAFAYTAMVFAQMYTTVAKD